jgi:F-type H+-transporting ATPase subunit gamma
MTQSLKHMKNRIRIIDNIKKISYAMEMISVVKFKKLETTLLSTRTYYSKLNLICASLLYNNKNFQHAYLRPSKKSNKILLAVNSSDTGLCGSYNNNVIKTAEAFIKNRTEDFVIMPIGKKCFNYFKNKDYVLTKNIYTELHSKVTDENLENISKDIIDYFMQGEVKEVHWLYTYFGGNMKYETRIEKILDLEFNEKSNVEYNLDSSLENILNNILPLYIETKIGLMMIESFTSEQSARLIAMNMATTNAKDLLENLILEMNKTRQALITREVTEIISSAEAVK